MVSWRSWFAVVLVAVATAAACSGKTDSPPARGKGGSAGRGVSGGSAGHATGGSGVGGTTGGTFTEGGEGGAAAVGGSAGGLLTGGTGFGGTAGGFPLGGSAGAAGFGTAGFGVAGSGTGGSPPFTWTCTLLAWGNGQCDCGCGSPDPDCKNGDIDTCKVCDTVGSCSGAKCPGRINEDDTTKCEPVPTGWSCPLRNYDDGKSCDCGCGIVDPDCEGEERDVCDECALIGSCSFRDCPGGIDADDNSQCFIPAAWSCSSFDYGDGTCDCGCGAKDVDCASLSVDDCQTCTRGCSFETCPGTIDPDNSSFCTTPPFNWTCSERFYNDGAICHCGCGAIDPDCDPIDPDSCDRCNVQGSCSAQDCPGTINPELISTCIQPEPPPEWICDWFYYGDGSSCDCGCGAIDPDCRGSTPSSCNSCWGCGECPGRVDPMDISQCSPPPDGWTCPDDLYGDFQFCDCGCGVMDPDCAENNIDYCGECPEGSCSRTDCRDVDPDDITICDGGIPPEWACPSDYYGDTACDCGCGAKDEDCRNLTVGACEFCNSPGSCSVAATCPGTIDPNDNTTCE